MAKEMLAIIAAAASTTSRAGKHRWVKAESSFGAPSDEVLIGELAGQSIAFLPRHGRGHKIPRRKSTSAPTSTRSSGSA